MPPLPTELVTLMKRRVAEFLSELERDREAILITQHRLSSVCLMEVESYNALRQRMGLLEGIARGEKAVEEGRVLTQAAARRRMGRWLK